MIIEGESLEEHNARLQKISEEIKADIKAGRYRNGQLHPYVHGSLKETIDAKTHRFPSRGYGLMDDSVDLYSSKAFIEFYTSDWAEKLNEAVRLRDQKFSKMFTLDSIPSSSRRPPVQIVMDECHYIEPKDMWLSEPKEKDWERKTFKSGNPTTPSEATRIKRRKERNKKKKAKK